MSDVTLEPYLYFKGQAREAMEFYKSIFGGELEVMSYADAPGPIPGADDGATKDWLMHAHLQGGDIKLMASDTTRASDKAAKVELSIGGHDETRLREIFGKLSDGAEVRMPLKKEFWGDIFGNLTDRYGVTWNMNITVPKAAG